VQVAVDVLHGRLRKVRGRPEAGVETLPNGRRPGQQDRPDRLVVDGQGPVQHREGALVPTLDAPRPRGLYRVGEDVVGRGQGDVQLGRDLPEPSRQVRRPGVRVVSSGDRPHQVDTPGPTITGVGEVLADVRDRQGAAGGTGPGQDGVRRWHPVEADLVELSQGGEGGLRVVGHRPEPLHDDLLADDDRGVGLVDGDRALTAHLRRCRQPEHLPAVGQVAFAAHQVEQGLGRAIARDARVAAGEPGHDRPARAVRDQRDLEARPQG
jgi:hypothetical protein